jgi:3-hydroxyacyl-CoA dehydrogenase/enoyl-CoA hydratase/3-hydroxybutyryl-CoA epimerase
MSLLGGTVDYSGFANVDLVIEAVFEDINVKHQVLREVEAELKPSAIFASNTSTIPIVEIARASSRPERVVGMHFFSPVHKMPLLEVIEADATDVGVVASVVAYGKKLGKTVIVVHDGPGFYVNRILTPYINEAGRLLDQGAAIYSISDFLSVPSHSSMRWDSTLVRRRARSCTTHSASGSLLRPRCRQWLRQADTAER